MVPSSLFLTGEYEHKIDAKNRLFVPAALRDVIEIDADLETDFFLVLGPNKILSLYPYRYFRHLAEANREGLVRSQEAVDFDRVTFALTMHLVLDNNNRLTLPGKMLKRAGIDKDVVLIGARDHIEIWDAKVWKEYLQEHLDNYEGVLDLGRAAQGQEAQKDNKNVGRSH